MPKQTAQPPTLHQATFAARLTEAFEAAEKWGVQAKDVAEKLGWNETTLSRYKNPLYRSGPPREQRRRALEREIGIPQGYLDRAAGDLSLLRKAVTGFGESGTRPDLLIDMVSAAKKVASALENALDRSRVLVLLDTTSERARQQALVWALKDLARQLHRLGFDMRDLFDVTDELAREVGLPNRDP